MAFKGGFGPGDRPRASRSGNPGAGGSGRDGRGDSRQAVSGWAGNGAARGPAGGNLPVYDHPSVGQVVSGLGNAVALGTGSVLGLIGNVASSDAYGRTPLGRAIDAATGGTPEPPDRWEAPRERYNIDATGEKGRVLDRRNPPAPPSDDPLATEGGPAEPSDVMLQDRRRPTGLYAGTALLSKRA